MKRISSFVMLLAAVVLSVSTGCAPGTGAASTPTRMTANRVTDTPIPTLASSETDVVIPTLASGPTETAVPTLPAPSPVASTPTANAGTATLMPNQTQSPTSPTLAGQLGAALELAANEMRAAQNAGTVAEAKSHAEMAVNILVGKFGRWYGDGDGDGKINAPSDTRGVLPAEKSPVSGGADGDGAAQFPFGLALLAAGRTTNSPELTTLLGDAAMWRAKPRDGYDAIANAVAQDNVSALEGAVPRAVAYGRLILTKAQSADAAKPWAGDAVKELESAIQAARAMGQ